MAKETKPTEPKKPKGDKEIGQAFKECQEILQKAVKDCDEGKRKNIAESLIRRLSQS